MVEEKHFFVEDDVMARESLDKKLIGNADAKIWAEEFVKMVKKKPSIATDEGTMIGWFANAIMAGYDSPNNISKQKVREAIYKICILEIGGGQGNLDYRGIKLIRELELE